MSDIIQDVKVTPIPGKQKLTLVLLNLVILCSGISIGASLTFMRLKDRLMPPNSTPPIMDHIERMTREYSLTPEQKEKVTPLFETYQENLKKMFSDSSQAMTNAKETFVAGMKKVLDPDQYEKWYNDLTEQEQRRQRRSSFNRRGMMGGRRGGGRGERSGPQRMWDANRIPDPNKVPPWMNRDGQRRFNDMNMPPNPFGSGLRGAFNTAHFGIRPYANFRYNPWMTPYSGMNGQYPFFPGESKNQTHFFE